MLINLLFIIFISLIYDVPALAASANNLTSFYQGSLSTIDFDTVEWDKAISVRNDAEFISYVNTCLYYGITTICVNAIDNYQPIDVNRFCSIFSLPYCEREYKAKGSVTSFMYKFIEYPGTRVARAYLRNDKRGLTDRELKLYDVAVYFINNTLNRNNPALLQELQIHDFICNSTSFFDYPTTNRFDEFKSAIGVFLNGEANCQGYADAFFMLCRMAGFDVNKISGVASGVDHVWNLIKLSNNWYMVDVTSDDSMFSPNISYAYFNMSKSQIIGNHSWQEGNLLYPVKDNPDGNYLFYSAYAYALNLYYVTDANAFYSSVAYMMATVKKPVQFMASNFPIASPNDTARNVGTILLSKYGITPHVSTIVDIIGKNTFLYIKNN